MWSSFSRNLVDAHAIRSPLVFLEMRRVRRTSNSHACNVSSPCSVSAPSPGGSIRIQSHTVWLWRQCQLDDLGALCDELQEPCDWALLVFLGASGQCLHVLFRKYHAIVLVVRLVRTPTWPRFFLGVRESFHKIGHANREASRHTRAGTVARCPLIRKGEARRGWMSPHCPDNQRPTRSARRTLVTRPNVR